jgi:PhnB protein
MPTTWKPEAYNSVSVYIVADNAQRVIDFLKKTFEATDLRRFDAPDGKITHAEVRIDDTVIMIADADGAYPSFPVWLHVYVPDAQATYKKRTRGRWRRGPGTRPQTRRLRPPRRR